MLFLEIVVGVYFALWLFGAAKEDDQQRQRRAFYKQERDLTAGHIFGRPLPMWLRAKQFRTGPAAQ